MTIRRFIPRKRYPMAELAGLPANIQKALMKQAQDEQINYDAIEKEMGAHSHIASPARARGVELFVIGAMTARTVFKFTLADALLTALDAYFKTAPAAVTAASCAQIKVSGSVSGSVTFQFAANVNEFHLSQSDLSNQLAQIDAIDIAGLGNYNNTNGMAYGFDPTANMTVLGISFRGHATPTNIRVGLGSLITTSNGYTAATTPWLTTSAGVPAYVDVLAGAITPTEWNLAVFNGSVSLSSAINYSVIHTGIPTVGTSTCNTKGNNDNGVFTGSVADLGAFPYTVELFTNTWAFNSLNKIPTRLHGGVGGTPLVGVITVEITMAGTPATPGSDLIIGMQM